MFFLFLPDRGPSRRVRLFTRLLLDVIPLDCKQLVELDCGLAAAAHTLLPSLPDARYLGLDFNPERLAEAKSELVQARIAPRVQLRLAPSTNIPTTRMSENRTTIFIV